MESLRQRRLRVLMFPWLAHGHVSPFLELSKRLAKRDFHIYFCSTPINLDNIRRKLSPKDAKSITLVDLHLPTDLPPHYHTTNGLPPALMNALKKAFDMSVDNFAELLDSLKPDLVVYDFIQPWAPEVASRLGIPAVHFVVCSVATASFLFHMVESPEEEFPFPEMRDIHQSLQRLMMRLIQNESNGIKDVDRVIQSYQRSSGVVLVKTFKGFQDEHLDYVGTFFRDKKLVVTGPLVQAEEEDDEQAKGFTGWLDKKEKSSTVFVSFGSEYFLSDEDLEEMALGLELSNVNFIWVIRFPTGQRKTLEHALPKGFLDRVSGRGLIVENWAPQGKILRHGSIGGFVSHCGWSSVMESMSCGVPIVAVPMHLDQPVNSRLLTSAGVGLEVGRLENGRIDRAELARVVREVVVQESGEAVRRRAREMGDLLDETAEEEMDGVAEQLAKVCGMRNRNGTSTLYLS